MTPELFYENIRNQYSNNLPFVAYRKPDEQLVSALLQEDGTIYSTINYDESGFVFAPFDDNATAVLIPIEKSRIIKTTHNLSDFRTKINEIVPASNLGKNEHLELVQKGLETINSGILKKVVLSRNESIQIDNNNPIDLFHKLLSTYQTAFVYIWYHPKIGFWLGASPEVLLSIKGLQLETMALAGTKPYNSKMEVDWGKKELEEQQIVTEFIVDGLQSMVSNIKLSDTENLKAGNVWHLKTSISGTLNPGQNDLKRLLNNLHPTPATCGLPRLEAQQFILQNENYKREFYTGFLGELNFQEKHSRNKNKRNQENSAYGSLKKSTNLFVNLRCMQIKGGNAHIYVGGGITKDSIPEDEWVETVNKANTMKKVL